MTNTVIKSAKIAKHEETDSFRLASSTWYPEHESIATAYGKSKEEVFAEVTKTEPNNLDALFSWLQTKYVLTTLLHDAPPLTKQSIERILSSLEHFVVNRELFRFIDYWLPAWVRLCWRAGFVSGTDTRTNVPVTAESLPLVPRHLHIPILGISIVREDLRAAAIFIHEIGDRISKVNFDKFPGAIFLEGSGTLYVPLPVWRGAISGAELSGLKPIADDIRSSGMGFVNRIKLLGVKAEGPALNASEQASLKTKFQAQLSGLRVATEGAVDWATFDDFRRDIDG